MRRRISVGQPRHNLILSRQLDDGSAGELFRAAVPRENQWRARRRHDAGHIPHRVAGQGENGQQVESAGPITMGTRLESSQDPSAWRSVTYGKGTWIIHMLRRYLETSAFSPCWLKF